MIKDEFELEHRIELHVPSDIVNANAGTDVKHTAIQQARGNQTRQPI